ncbi:MAG: hypothetical protein JKY30_12975 [Flavobacteriales bacterium]|nr:hypothetical protein [Flavobacteriales bacterium]
MKTYLFLSIFIYSCCNLSAQKTTITFNQYKGLTTNNKKVLDDVYHDMNDLNNHYFDLVSQSEKESLQHLKLLKLAKARIQKVTDYYTKNLQIEEKNLVVIYGSQYPILSLYKPKSRLTASGKIVLEENDRQCFDYYTDSNNPITSGNGNKFYFPPNAFETLNGKQIINQNIDICIWEFMDKKTLIYSGLTTDANGEMLETAGSFYIEATYNGEELKLRRGESYTVEMASKKSFPDMFTYYGGNKDGIIDWNVNKNEPAIYNTTSQYELDEEVEINIEQQQYDEYGDVIEGDQNSVWDAPFGEYDEEPINFYEMTAGKLGWINCDRFYEVKNTSALAIRVNTDAQMVVRLVFRDINSVMPAYSNSNHYDQYEVNGIPKGEKVLLLAYSVKDDNAVFGYKEIVIGENEVENISLNSLSKTRFKSAVSELLSFNN